MTTVNVLIVVDAAQLAQQIADGTINPGSQRFPTRIKTFEKAGVYITLIFHGGNINNNTFNSSVTDISPNHDQIEWSITTFANNFNHSVFLYRVQNHSRRPKTQFKSMSVDNYLPSPGAGASIGEVKKYTNQVALVSSKCSRKYTLCFQLWDNGGTVLGYFKWTPDFKNYE